MPDLHHLCGTAFVARYTAYEAAAERGEIRIWKRLPAVQLWRRMLTSLYETGHPWITFKDACNLRSPQDHVGVVHSSNPCTEITLNTSPCETAVCNLGSVNLARHLTAGRRARPLRELRRLEMATRAAAARHPRPAGARARPADRSRPPPRLD